MRRTALFFLIFILVGWVFVRPAHAQFNPMPGAEEFGAIVDQKTKDGQMSKEVYTVNTQASYMNTGTCMLVGCSKDPASAFYYGKSAVAMSTQLIAGMYDNPPANLALWVHDTAQTLGFETKPAYAQGIGFSGFSGLLPLWKVFRNIAYFLLAAVMIVIGFMVMFRKKIDPKTVVTVQNALPKIVLTLVLITFSYAIVGLMIDLMYVVILLMVGIFQSSHLLPDPSAIVKLIYPTNQSLYSQGNLLYQITNIFGISTPIPGANVGGITSPIKLIYQVLGLNPAVAGWASAGSLILGVGLALGTPLGPWGLLAALPAALSVVLGLLISLALLFLVIRLFIFFLTSYIQIILALIFAPVQLVFEAVPGSTAFSSWFKNLFANLIVFPIGAGAFMLSAVFMNMANGTNTQLWNPPLTTLVPSSTRSLSALVGLGILFIIPTIAGQIKESLKAKPLVAAGPEGIVGSFGQPVQLAMQGYQMWVSHESMKAFRGMAPGGKKRDTSQESV